MSVDLEDWYHICGIENQQWADEWQKYSSCLEKNVDKILHLFEKYDVKATFFVVGYIADKNPALIKKIADSGHELAAHGYFHRRIFDMTPEEFENDLLKAKKAIEAVSGKKILGYRAPEWSLKKGFEWVLDVLKKNDFEYDASANPLSHCSGKHFGIYPNQIKTKYGKIYEFPLSTARWFQQRLPFSGGLPMRLNPYFYIADVTQFINKSGFPAIFLLHPWEFDTERADIDLPFNRKFMHYFNRIHVPGKIELMLQRFEFTTLEEVLRLRKSEEPAQRRAGKKQKLIDKEYVKSFTPPMSAYFVYLVISALMAPHIGFFILLPIAVILTIWYWPWGLLFRLIGFIKKP